MTCSTFLIPLSAGFSPGWPLLQYQPRINIPLPQPRLARRADHAALVTLPPVVAPVTEGDLSVALAAVQGFRFVGFHCSPSPFFGLGPYVFSMPATVTSHVPPDFRDSILPCWQAFLTVVYSNPQRDVASEEVKTFPIHLPGTYTRLFLLRRSQAVPQLRQRWF